MRRDYGPTRPSAYYESSYDLAVRRGFKGTLDDWLASLRGAPGPAYGNVVSASSYGAKGDGKADDTQAVKTALQAAGVGGTVLLDADRTYLVTQTLELADGQTIDGNGATLLWEGEAPDGNVNNAPFIIHAAGSVDDEITITAPPKTVGVPSSKYRGQDSPHGFTTITVAQDPGYQLGDRIVIQAIRNALAQESGAWWCGTPTGTVNPSWWAEVLVVNDVQKTGDDEWTIRCVGGLIYPYYLTAPTAEDNSCRLEDVWMDAEGHAVIAPPVGQRDGLTVAGYRIWHDGGGNTESFVRRSCSTIRKVNFLRGVTIRNITVLANGQTHTGDLWGDEGVDWTATSNGNTICLDLCEDALLENVHVKMGDLGRGFYFRNCFRSKWQGCSVETDCPVYGYPDVHVYRNYFSFLSCWYCEAEGCTTIGGGQSFDQGYGSVIRCPTLHSVVRNSTVYRSMGSASTNHSGAWGSTWESCRFIACARPLAVRSPMSHIKNCTFQGHFGTSADPDYPGVFDPNEEHWHIEIGEPTTFGSTIEGCTFTDGIGIRITTWLTRFFNYNEGDYLTIDPETDIVSGNPFPPDRKALGIRVAHNTFKACNGVFRIGRAERWLTDDQGNLTDYAKADLDVEFSDNDMIDCGTYFWPIIIDRYVNGVTIRNNRFARCVGAQIPTDDPVKPYAAYFRRQEDTDPWEPVATPYLIRVEGNNVRIAITDNTVSECGGGFSYLYYAPLSVPVNMGTNGVAQFVCHGNRIDRKHGEHGGMFLTAGSTDAERSFAQPGKTAAERLIDSVDAGDGGSGLAYEFSTDVGSVSLVTNGVKRFTVSASGAFNPVMPVPDCLLRTWLQSPNEDGYTARYRIALYEVTDDFVMTPELYGLVAEKWDSTGTDHVDFDQPVEVIITDDADEGDEGGAVQTEVTVPAPVNSIQFTNADEAVSGDQDTGIVTVTVTAGSTADRGVAAFYAIPASFDPDDGTRYVLICEILENGSGSYIRVNVWSGDENPHPPVFDEVIRDASGAGTVSAYNLIYHAPERIDLGRPSYPWKRLYAQALTLGNTSLSEAQLQALLALL